MVDASTEDVCVFDKRVVIVWQSRRSPVNRAPNSLDGPKVESTRDGSDHIDDESNTMSSF